MRTRNSKKKKQTWRGRKKGREREREDWWEKGRALHRALKQRKYNTVWFTASAVDMEIRYRNSTNPKRIELYFIRRCMIQSWLLGEECVRVFDVLSTDVSFVSGAVHIRVSIRRRRHRGRCNERKKMKNLFLQYCQWCFTLFNFGAKWW